jgi:hypothetical protein
MDWVYDLETYPNIFTMAIGAVGSEESGVFEISSRRDDSRKMRRFLKRLYVNKDRMIGFNNIGFDYPILHHFMTNKNVTYSDLYDKAQEIIEDMQEDNKFKHIIPAHKQFIEQIDLFKIHHFDNRARATSLKMIEFNMRSDNIEDLPFPPGSVLTEDQMETLIKYNTHDVYQTYLFYKETTGAIEFREELSRKYKRNFLNHNDTKIGKDYFVMKLEEEMPGSCYRQLSNGQRKINQTKRDYIDLGDIVFDYVKFNRPEFQAVVEWFKQQRITETKGVFSDIPEEHLGELAQYCNMLTKKKKFKQEPTQEDLDEFYKEHPKGWVEEKLLKSGKTSYYGMWRVAKNLNTVVDGFQYDFGTGGLHGSIESQVVESDNDNVLIDLDVASYYPNLAISNRIYPAHLSENFCNIYQDVYEQRKSYAKGTPENAMMKLALNGIYGDSNNQYSPFYDPRYTMSITINGQLSLCMLAESLCEIEGLSMVQANTDGVTVIVPRKSKEEVDRKVKEWENVTGLELEEAIYSKMCIKDVNNYLAVGDDGKIKRKGAYQYDGLGWHQNQSSLVIPMAAEHALVKGGDVEQFIRTHKNKYDFLLRTKVPRSSRLVTIDEDGVETPQQNICRYYISKEGSKLVKIMPPLPGKDEERYIGIDKEWSVKTCNNILDFQWDIDYDYYINEARKLVDPLLN